MKNMWLHSTILGMSVALFGARCLAENTSATKSSPEKVKEATATPDWETQFVDESWEVARTTRGTQFSLRRIRLLSQDGREVLTGLLLKPLLRGLGVRPFSAVLYLHQFKYPLLGGGEVFYRRRGAEDRQIWAHDLVDKGYMVLAMDAIDFGARLPEKFRQELKDPKDLIKIGDQLSTQIFEYIQSRNQVFAENDTNRRQLQTQEDMFVYQLLKSHPNVDAKRVAVLDFTVGQQRLEGLVESLGPVTELNRDLNMVFPKDICEGELTQQMSLFEGKL